MTKKINLKKITIKELAEMIGAHLSSHDISAVLVGGACVSIYSENRYMSYDLDLVTHESSRKIKAALEEIGFKYDKKKYYSHPDCKFFLEFLVPPVAIGNEPINKFNTISSDAGSINILTPTDCVKDRLAAYIHWDDKESLEQAVMVAASQEIDIKEIKRWAKNENNGEKIKAFLEKFK
ncbi:MAG: hypothetical protein Q7U10_04915 [Thermodesulfovibrionia bacterium]|nr:hypothetical protein [Thermodesulfovibrionia bacterium]